MSDAVLRKAADILRLNDRGTYTVPTHGLYPFQWNWDSCLTALGQSHVEEDRAWTEIDTLFAHQWEDGMVPHIVFHRDDEGYFPGPAVWGTNRPVPTSGITQPPVAGFAVKRLFDRARERRRATDRVRRLLPKIHAWHQWFYTCRDPGNTGLVAIVHPWESGRDNSIDWDEAFKVVPTDGLMPFTRRDTRHADSDHRPTQFQYERYIWLVQRFRELGWDNRRIHAASAFRIVDPGFNAILLRSVADVSSLARDLGETDIARASSAWLDKGIGMMESLWNRDLGQYVCFDRVAGRLVDSASVAGLLAAVAPLPRARVRALSDRIRDLTEQATFMVPSHDPRDPRFDAKRYWRGPAWLIVNYLISDGLLQAGEHEMAERIEADSLRLIDSGFAEYYDPLTGDPCGGGQFTWTAAMAIELLARPGPAHAPSRHKGTAS